MLINRTAIEVINKLINSDYYDKIYPINTIHDAIYFICQDDPEVIKWLNDNLIEAMRWNDHPAIKSDDVPMEANLDIGKTWSKQFTLNNNASIEEINEVLNKVYDN